MRESDFRREILDEIERRAPHYTPEWRYDKEHPDAGTALFMLWADMHTGTFERFSWLHDNFRRALFDAIGSDPRPPVPAAGFLAFGVREDAGDFVIPKGTQVAAPSKPEAVLVTCQSLMAGRAKISDIYHVMPQADRVARLSRLNDTELTGSADASPHVWTFAHEFALNTSFGAQLRLTPDTHEDGLDTLAASLWEYFDGESHHAMGVIREGASLLCALPKDRQSCKAVRVSIADDITLNGIMAKPSGKDMHPDALYAEGSQVQDGFFPFDCRFIPGACAYFSSADALTKPGARVELVFTLGFEDFEIEGYPELQRHMRNIMKVSEFEPLEEYSITAATAKWEYYNGIGWAALETDASELLFKGDTSGRVRIAFDCPNDMSYAVVGAHELPFIRVRLIAADNLYRRRGRYKAPFISDIRFGYRYEGGVPITDITVNEHLDTFKRTLPARLAKKPEGPPALYFASDNAYTRGTILFHLGEAGKSAASRWEYLSHEGWLPLGVRDDTNGLAKTGILSYQVTTPAAHGRLWGRDAYWIRLVLEAGAQGGAYLYGLYENSVRAVAKTAGRGSALPAGSYTTILTPLPGASSAQNPIAVFGGAEKEDEAGIIRRLSAELSHSGNAVSSSDCEALALEASMRVHRVKYYKNTDENGDHAYGHSCLVVLPRDADEFEFDNLRDELMAYISKRRPLGAERLSILSPRYIPVNVYASIMTEDNSDEMAVKEGISSALARLFSPENFDIGHLPTPGQISAAIRSVHGVFRLIRCDVAYTMATGVMVNYTRADKEAFILPVSGKHELLFADRGFV